jgi:hypothetical protein
LTLRAGAAGLDLAQTNSHLLAPPGGARVFAGTAAAGGELPPSR